MEKSKRDRIAQALGAKRVVAVEKKDSQGPLGLLWLREEIVNRLRSTGGRPTDPSWTERRCIPFDPKTWDSLVHLADQMSTSERKVTPGQVAALLVERELARADSR